VDAEPRRTTTETPLDKLQNEQIRPVKVALFHKRFKKAENNGMPKKYEVKPNNNRYPGCDLQ
jgi:hypothetical protein